MKELPISIIEILKKANNINLFEESYEFTGVYPWINKFYDFKINHFYISPEIAKDRLRRSAIWEKYNLLGC